MMCTFVDLITMLLNNSNRTSSYLSVTQTFEGQYFYEYAFNVTFVKYIFCIYYKILYHTHIYSLTVLINLQSTRLLIKL